MTVDTSELATLVAAAMTAAEEFGEECYIRTIAVVLEVDSPDSSQFVWKFSEDRPWVNVSFLREAADLLQQAADRAAEDAAEEDD